jgi:predicted nucleotidyltransferase
LFYAERVKKVGLFGSFAKNQQTADSDIDFIVEFEEEKNFCAML